MTVTGRGSSGRGRGLLRRGLAIAVAVFAALGGTAWWLAVDEQARTECGFTPPELPERLRRASGAHADWEWWPPGHVCIYTDDEGRVIGRRRL